MDKFLQKFADKYDKWLKEDKIDRSASVIPVAASLSPTQQIMPSEQAIAILRSAHTFALSPCTCREHYKRCDKPVETCFFLNSVADKLVASGRARSITLEEAEAVIESANNSGLVHMRLYQPDREMFALCNCCSCCCHDLQLLLKHQRRDLIGRADFVAETSNDDCIHCGVCIDRCAFKARSWNGDEVVFNESACYGCGLCVTTCPQEAIHMRRLGT